MSLSAPLTSPHPLVQFVEDSFLDSSRLIQDPEHSKLMLKQTLKVIGCIAAVASRVSMVNVCFTAGTKISETPLNSAAALEIGITNSIGTVLGSGLISVLAVNNLVNDLIRRISPAEQSLLANSTSKPFRRTIAIISLAGGLISQIPMAVGSYFGSVPPIPGSFSALSQIADFARPAYSIHQRLSLAAIHSCHCAEDEVAAFQKRLTEQVRSARALIDTDSAERHLFISALENLVETQQSGDKFLKLIMETARPSNNLRTYRIINTVATAVAFVLLAEYGMIAFGGIARLYPDHPALPIIAGIFTFCANFDILMRLTKTGMIQMYDRITCSSPPSLLREKDPRLHDALTLIGVAISMLPWAPSIYFAEEYFPSALQTTVGIVSALAIFMCSVAATSAFRDHIVRRAVQRRGEGRFLDLQDVLENIGRIIERSSREQMRSLYRFFCDN